jgi:predicted Zn-ribbon and HTH transcriptional regulator
MKITETKNNNQDTTKTYSCPMHPEVKLDKPGKCPKCGMDLIAKNSLFIEIF